MIGIVVKQTFQPGLIEEKSNSSCRYYYQLISDQTTKDSSETTNQCGFTTDG